MNRAIPAVSILSLCGVLPGTVARAETSPGERDNTPRVTISSIEIAEGDSGLTPFSVELSLYGGSLPIAVRVYATPNTASEEDYVFAPTEVVLGAADGGVPTVSGFIVGDIEAERDESFTLTAVAIPDDRGITTPIYSFGGYVVIKDDDVASASLLRAEGASLLEGHQGTTTAEVRVTLEPASTSIVKVYYRTAYGNATPGQDYVEANGTLTFEPGEVSKTIGFQILGDTTPEGDESFAVVLSAPSIPLLGSAVAGIVIVNDDAWPDGGDALPPSRPVEGSQDAPGGGDVPELGGSDSPILPATADAANGGDVSSYLDSGPGAAVDSGPGPARDASAEAPEDAPQVTDGPAPGLASGCSCSVHGPRSPVGMLLLAGLVIIALRRRSR